MARETLFDVDQRIRTLSALITNLNKQVDSPNHLESSPALNACNQIAILLTRGIEDAKNTAGHRRRGVAVSGRLASHVSLAVCVDSGEEAVPLDSGERQRAGELSDAISTQNPTPRDRTKFKIDHITPSPTSLKDIGGLPYVPSVTVCILLTGIRVFPGST